MAFLALHSALANQFRAESVLAVSIAAESDELGLDTGACTHACSSSSNTGMPPAYRSPDRRALNRRGAGILYKLYLSGV